MHNPDWGFGKAGLSLALYFLAFSVGCPEKKAGLDGGRPSAEQKAVSRRWKVGLVTDLGGRGDQSFNDSALRGLELWAAGLRYTGNAYVPVTPEEIRKSLPEDLSRIQPPIQPLSIEPLVLQSKAQEDYEPNLQLLVDQRADLIIGTGFMLENAVEAVAKRNPKSRFLLIDSPILDSQGKAYALPNTRTIVFREEEGSFLAGALAALVSPSQKIAFVGGMESALIKKFEAGFKTGALYVRPTIKVAINYTGSFDNIAAGKQIAQDLVVKGNDVVYHAAGACGEGVIQAVKEARSSGKIVYAIGVDSDQYRLAPNAVLTSMLKRVDLAVYLTIRDLVDGRFQAGDLSLGLKDSGVALAEVRLDIPNKASRLEEIERLRQRIISGAIKVPSTAEEATSFKASP
jgi:basic membrane protein A